MKAVLCLGFGACFILVAQIPDAHAAFPERPIRVLVGFPPGSQPDFVARLFAEKFSRAWGQPVVVDNVPGAAGNISAERVAKAAPNGYTLGLLGQGPIVINPSLYKLAYDPVKDLVPISQVYFSPTLLVVHNAVAAIDLRELVALAKARPGTLTYASGGIGGASHMAAELFKAAAGVDIRHIPYRGTVAAITDLISGRVSMMLSPTADVLALVREGKLRALAVTSSSRSSAAPQLPTIAESGYPGFEFTVWQGFFAPAQISAEIVGKIQRETVKDLALPDLRARLADLGLEGIGNSSEQFSAIIRSQAPQWAKVIREAKIRPD